MKIVSSFSLLILCVLGFAQDFSKLNEEIDKIDDPQQLIEYVSEHYPQHETDKYVTYQVAIAEEAIADGDEEYIEQLASELKEMIALRAQQSKESGTFTDAQKRAESIKAAPYYNDPGANKDSNWLQGAAEKLAKLFEKKDREQEAKTPSLRLPTMGFLIPLMWTLIALVVIIFAVFIIMNISSKRGLKRKATALLDDDEPERTLDEWLELATKLSQAKNYREAVRCLYLACLLKFDEYNVARFDRGETNWEHLARINRSPRKPEQIDFESPTQLFDRVWYGRHVRGIEDVEQFQIWYKEITTVLKETTAA